PAALRRRDGLRASAGVARAVAGGRADAVRGRAPPIRPRAAGPAGRGVRPTRHAQPPRGRDGGWLGQGLHRPRGPPPDVPPREEGAPREAPRPRRGGPIAGVTPGGRIAGADRLPILIRPGPTDARPRERRPIARAVRGQVASGGRPGSSRRSPRRLRP